MNRRTAKPRSLRLACVVVAILALVSGWPLAGAAEAATDLPRFMVDVWTADDGLPSSAVTGLAQTSDGYLWIGTHKGGLVRFDGMDFKRPTHSAIPPLPGREVTMLEVDEGGTMWVEQAGPYRLISYQNGVFTTRYKPQPGAPVHFVGVAGSENEVVLATTKGKLARVLGGEQVSAVELLDLDIPLRCAAGGWARLAALRVRATRLP